MRLSNLRQQMPLSARLADILGASPRTIQSYALSLLFLVLLPASAYGQAVGAIVGTVTDPTGAVMPRVKITATNEATRVSRSTITSGAGTYTLANLPVGTYSVKAETEGFKAATAAAISLDVSQERQVNFKLVVVGVEAKVEVNATPPLLNTTDATLGGLVNKQQVETLPLNGRSIDNLVMMQPGMAGDTGGMGWLAPQWISNGNRGETLVATLDNADASDTEMGTPQFWNFNLDAIDEFKVLQNNYSAMYGQGGGTITQIVSKSGSNQFHGSAFEFVRNSVFDARNYFATDVPPFQRNEFGVTFGGPIKKNKTFFFGEYAGFRQRLGEPTIMPVPTADERKGIVSIGSFQYQVPLNPVAQEVLGKYPLPNQPNGVYGLNTLNVLYKQPTNNDQFSIRLDHHISEKDSLFVRVSYINNNQENTDSIAAIEDPAFSESAINKPRNYTISETHTFSPTLLNTFSFTLNRQIEGYLPATQSTPQTIFDDGSLANWGPDTFITKYVENNFVPQDNVAWTKGRNTFNIGGNFRRIQDNGFGVTSLGPNGVYEFAPGTPLAQTINSTNGGPPLLAGSGSPNGLVSMMEGVSLSYGRATTIPGFGPPGGGGTKWGVRRWHLAGWIQDDLMATSKLTLNLGFRYEYNSVPWEIGNRLGGVVDQGNLFGHFVLNPNPLYTADYKGFAPRFGLAYQLDKKTVVRGGVGIFTNNIPTVYPDQAAVNFPLAALSYLQDAPYSMTPLAVSLPVLTSTSGTPMPPNGDTRRIPANTPVDLAPIADVIGDIAGDYPSDQMKNGYTISTNLTVERELPGNINFTVSYVGNLGKKLYQESFPNAYEGAQPQYTPYTNVTPGLGELLLIYNRAHSNYNALQVQARKESPSHGLAFQANYTWAKNLTDADAVWSAPGESGGITLNNPQCIECEYARASYNVAHRVVGNFEYDVPLAHFTKLPQRLARGWKLLGIFSAQSGLPFTVVGPYGTLQYGYDSFDGVGARPFLVQMPTRVNAGGPQFFSDAVIANSNAIGEGGSVDGPFFAIPTMESDALGTVQSAPGNLRRNTFTGPGWWNFDSSLIKDTQITERIALQFRAEFFNLFNHATFGGPTSTLGDPSFGVSTGTATAERQIQFGLRLTF
jgi:hypothetical protein